MFDHVSLITSSSGPHSPWQWIAEMNCSTTSGAYQHCHNQILYLLCRRLYSPLCLDEMRSCSEWLDACSSEALFPTERHQISRRDEPWRGIRPRWLDRAHWTQQGKRLSELPDGIWLLSEVETETRRCSSVTLKFILTSISYWLPLTYGTETLIRRSHRTAERTS